MAEFELKKGLDLPIEGRPENKIYDIERPRSAAVIGADYIGLKPKMLIGEGDEVVRGTPLFCHKDSPDIFYVSPAKGRVSAINRGARRVLQSVVVTVDDWDDQGLDFGALNDKDVMHLARADVQARLYASGLWTAFLTRPYSKVPSQGAVPAAIYVSAMDTEPLAADPALILADAQEAFHTGLAAISHLTDGEVHVAHDADLSLSGTEIPNVTMHIFEGPHPAGLSGTHMHFVDPPSAEREMWSIGYQHVIAIGKLFLTGHLDVTRVISLAGPRAAKPRLVRTVAGAAIDDVIENEITGDDPVRVISGSVLSGRHAEGPEAYLGQFARQIALITEDRAQEVLGWLAPQPKKFAVQPVLASARLTDKLFNLTSNLNGGRRAMVPTGVFERLMPQDILPTQLLRALLVKDTDTAQALGALELAEEDLALCTFACPAKYEYGEALRSSLEKIEKEG